MGKFTGNSFFRSDRGRKVIGGFALSAVAFSTVSGTLMLHDNAVHAAQPAVSVIPAASGSNLSSTISNIVVKTNETVTTKEIYNGSGWSNSTSFSVPNGAHTGDYVDIGIPNWLTSSYPMGTAAGTTNIPVIMGDGTVIGTLTNTDSGFRMIFNTNVENKSGVTAAATFNVFENVDPTKWKVGDTNPIQLIVNGKTYDTGVTATRTPATHPTGWDQRQEDIDGKPAVLDVVRIVNNNPAVTDGQTAAGPYQITVTPSAGTEFDCSAIQQAGGIAVRALKAMDKNTVGSDISYPSGNSITQSSVDNSTNVQPTNCSATSMDITVDGAALQLTDGTAAGTYSVEIPAMLTQASVDAKQTNFTGATWSVTGTKAGSPVTYTGTGTNAYVYQTAVGTGTNVPPQASLTAYIDDVTPQTPSGKTTSGEDSDADTTPGVTKDAIQGDNTVSLKYTNTGTTDWASAAIKDSSGKTVATIGKVAAGDSGVATVTVPIGVDATFTDNYTIVATDSTGQTVSDSNPVNAKTPAAPTGEDDTGTVKCGETVKVPVLSNDNANGSSFITDQLRLLAADGSQQTSVKVTNGTYTVNNGEIWFTADVTCTTEDIPPIKYTVPTTNGGTVTQTVTITKENATTTPDPSPSVKPSSSTPSPSSSATPSPSVSTTPATQQVVEGPKVQTDYVSSNAHNPLNLLGLSIF